MTSYCCKWDRRNEAIRSKRPLLRMDWSCICQPKELGCWHRHNCSLKEVGMYARNLCRSSCLSLRSLRCASHDHLRRLDRNYCDNKLHFHYFDTQGIWMAGCCLCFLLKIKMRSHYSSIHLRLKTEFKIIDCLPLTCFTNNIFDHMYFIITW